MNTRMEQLRERLTEGQKELLQMLATSDTEQELNISRIKDLISQEPQNSTLWDLSLFADGKLTPDGELLAELLRS